MQAQAQDKALAEAKESMAELEEELREVKSQLQVADSQLRAAAETPEGVRQAYTEGYTEVRRVLAATVGRVKQIWEVSYLLQQHAACTHGTIVMACLQRFNILA